MPCIHCQRPSSNAIHLGCSDVVMVSRMVVRDVSGCFYLVVMPERANKYRAWRGILTEHGEEYPQSVMYTIQSNPTLKVRHRPYLVFGDRKFGEPDSTENITALRPKRQSRHARHLLPPLISRTTRMPSSHVWSLPSVDFHLREEAL